VVRDPFEGPGIDDVNVRQPIAIVIEDGGAAAVRFEDVRDARIAILLDEAYSGPLGDVLEEISGTGWDRRRNGKLSGCDWIDVSRAFRAGSSCDERGARGANEEPKHENRKAHAGPGWGRRDAGGGGRLRSHHGVLRFVEFARGAAGGKWSRCEVAG